jgi:hypothetical protein
VEINTTDEIKREFYEERRVGAVRCVGLATLRLRETTVTPGTLSKLLTYTPALTNLEYDYWIAHDRRVRYRHLMEAFNLFKSTFERLKFTCWIKEETGDQSALAGVRLSWPNLPLHLAHRLVGE